MLKQIIASGLGVLVASIAVASNAIIPDDFPLEWGSIITVTGGLSWATGGENQYLYPSPLPDYQYYHSNSGITTAATGELFFGLQRLVAPQVIGQLGLGVAGLTDVNVTGTTDVNGVADAYSYSYKVNSVRVEFKGKLISNYFQMLQPYLSASLGLSHNLSHDYIPVLNNPAVTPPLWYASNAVVTFPYSVGVGVQKMINPNWQWAVGYQFADLGRSFLDGDDVFLDQGLRLTHLYTNELLFSISYLFS